MNIIFPLSVVDWLLGRGLVLYSCMQECIYISVYVCMLTHASKILLKVIAKRLQAKAEADKCLGEEQFGFRKGRGTRDAIGALRMLTERSLEHKQEVYICFVDYEKAFDRVDWKKLINALRRMGVDWRDYLLGNYLGNYLGN